MEMRWLFTVLLFPLMAPCLEAQIEPAELVGMKLLGSTDKAMLRFIEKWGPNPLLNAEEIALMKSSGISDEVILKAIEAPVALVLEIKFLRVGGRLLGPTPRRATYGSFGITRNPFFNYAPRTSRRTTRGRIYGSSRGYVGGPVRLRGHGHGHAYGLYTSRPYCGRSHRR